MGLSVAQVTFSLKSLWKYLWYYFTQLLILFQCQNRAGKIWEGPGLGISPSTDFSPEFQRKSHPLLFIISKRFTRGLLIPFLSHSLCPLFPCSTLSSLWRLLISVEFSAPLLLTASFPASSNAALVAGLSHSRFFPASVSSVLALSSPHSVFLYVI